MLRSHTLHRHFGRLALIALLLVALAPSVSRVLASRSTEVLAGWSQLCTSMGLKTLPSPGSGAYPADASAAKIPGSGTPCDYCSLAASLPMLLLALAFLLPRPPAGARPPRVAPRLRVVSNLRGLGSRGPPLLA